MLDLIEDEEKNKVVEPMNWSKNLSQKVKANQQNIMTKEKVSLNTSTALTIPSQSRADLQTLDEKVKSMMEKGQKKVPSGKNSLGTPIMATSWICKVCGKEDKPINIRNHIEANHLEGLSLPCDFCDRTFSARAYLDKHRNQYHK